MESISALGGSGEQGKGCRKIVNETVTDPYCGREQTQAKHFILERYLQALAFKVLTFSDVTYVDGFSGPWKTETEDFNDSSFMIAIRTLLEVQEKIHRQHGIGRNIRCFFSEDNPRTFTKLERSVRQFHNPGHGFEIKTYSGRFEDAVDEIEEFIGTSFPLIFIDPTGWSGYPFDKIKPLFDRKKCEVLINFMSDFVNRFTYSQEEPTVRSIDRILGGPGWQERLDPGLPRGLAVEKLFRETLKGVGDFKYVVSTKIDKATIDRLHFLVIYGTKHLEGLKVFREAEYRARRLHERNRANAKERKRQARTGMADLFSDHQAAVKESTIEEIVEEQSALASTDLMAVLSRNDSVRFDSVVGELLERYMLRETNIKDICVVLAAAGQIENTWGKGNRKPSGKSLIKLKVAS